MVQGFGDGESTFALSMLKIILGSKKSDADFNAFIFCPSPNPAADCHNVLPFDWAKMSRFVFLLLHTIFLCLL